MDWRPLYKEPLPWRKRTTICVGQDRIVNSKQEPGCETASVSAWLRYEPALVFLIFALFLAINFATGARYPVLWQDEVFFLDPAVNFATGRGFISSVDFCGTSTPQTFFACNTPLYPYVLGHWIKAFGVNLLAARSLNYILFSLAALFLWFTARRLKLIPSAGGRLLFLALILLGTAIASSFVAAATTAWDCCCCRSRLWRSHFDPVGCG